ncbi:hypothetical protein BYT27DRAFT_7245099 [Phlegmacium glaucopus]|nr:hypothetical protein BYT27DRAFT_7245099 [Phlegmacium glaucopus]
MAGPAEFVAGKLFIGLIFNVLLFGINVTQTYLYYIHSKKDPLWIKIWVIIVFVADFIQPLFCFLYIYQTLVVHFGDIPQLNTANTVFAVVPTMSGITAAIVHLFFAWRILILTNNRYYVAIVIVAALSGGVCAIVMAYEGKLKPQFADFRSFKAVPIVALCSEMLADIMTTSIMVWFLHKHKSGFRRSDMMVDRIIRVTMQTGLMMLIIGGLDMVFYLISPGGTHLLLNLIMSKLYTSSFLSSLNSRKGWGYDASDSAEDQFSTLQFSSDLGSDKTSGHVATTQDSCIELGSQQRYEVTDSCGAELDCERGLKS